MNSFQQINPYQQNYVLMRRFFAKPITLLLGIAYAAQWLGVLTLPYLFGDSDFQFQFNFFSLFMAIAFLSLFGWSRNKTPYASFSFPLTLLKVISIISIVLFSIVVFCLLWGIVFSLFEPSLFFIMLICLIACGSSLLSQIGFLKLISSFKKNLSSIYLYKNGALLTAIATIISIASSVSVVIFNDLIVESLKSFVEKYAYLYADEINIDALAAVNYSTSSLIQSGLSYAADILLIIFALSYYFYIKKISDGVNVYSAPSVQPAAAPNVSPSDFVPQPVFRNDEQTNPAAPLDFEPQPVFSDNESNPYAKAEPDSIVCPNCGTKSPSNMFFCGQCGTKLK